MPGSTKNGLFNGAAALVADLSAYAIIHKLRHGATLLPGKGVYQGRETNVLICVVSRGQAAALSEIVRATPNTFAVMSQVNQVFGDFKDRTSHSYSPMSLLDTGDADLTM